MRKETAVISLPDQAAHHDHLYHQLVFGLEGDTEFDLSGQCRPIKVGWGCLLPTSTEHMFCGLGDNRIVVVNTPVAIDDAEQQSRIEHLFRQPSYFNCLPEMILLLQALSREMLGNPQDKLLQDACAGTLICALQRHFERHQTLPRVQGQLNIHLIDDYIDIHISRRITVSELAGTMCLSSSQFYHRFRLQMGCTPQHYVLERRLNAARLALIHADTPLNQIALDFGFTAQSVLTRYFKSRFNLTPARYRQQYQRL